METLIHTTLKEDLRQFYGSELFYKYGSLKLTEGVKYLAENATCYWLLDLIRRYQTRRISNELFQVWRLERVHGDQFVAKATDGNGKQLVQQVIPYSDFPLDKIEIWLDDSILLLPTEY